MQRLRVLVLGINFGPEPTGIAPYTSGLVSGLADRGFDVRVLTTFPHYPQWRVADGWSGFTIRDTVEDVPVTRVRHYVPQRPAGIRRAASEVSFGLRAVMSGWDQPDVVICPSPALLSSSIAITRAQNGARRPAVGVIVQDLYSAGMEESARAGGLVTGAMTAIERRTLRSADGIVAIHRRFKSRIIEQFGLVDDDVTVIRNWTHVGDPVTRDRAAERARLGWGPDEVVVLHSGAMGEKQDLGNVVEAARLADAARRAVRFVLMGDGAQRSRLMAQAAGVERLDFLDPVSDARYMSVLGAADTLLVNEKPGVAEMAVPSKLTSYFRTGIPVLAATGADSTTAEEIAASGAGVRVAPGNPEILLAEALALASNGWRRYALGSRGPAYCESTLSESVALDAYASWVERLAGVATHESQSRKATASPRKQPVPLTRI